MRQKVNCEILFLTMYTKKKNEEKHPDPMLLAVDVSCALFLFNHLTIKHDQV